MGGAWVFPGGAVDATRAGTAHRAAAVREVEEEVAITLPDPAALVPFARWITPPEVSIRFDTYFFLAVAPDGRRGDASTGHEIVDARWFEPSRALEGAEADELLMVFPTIKTLEQLARFDTADALSSGRRRTRSRPVAAPRRGPGRDGADRASTSTSEPA